MHRQALHRARSPSLFPCWRSNHLAGRASHHPGTSAVTSLSRDSSRCPCCRTGRLLTPGALALLWQMPCGDDGGAPQLKRTAVDCGMQLNCPTTKVVVFGEHPAAAQQARSPVQLGGGAIEFVD